MTTDKQTLHAFCVWFNTNRIRNLEHWHNICRSDDLWPRAYVRDTFRDAIRHWNKLNYLFGWCYESDLDSIVNAYVASIKQ